MSRPRSEKLARHDEQEGNGCSHAEEHLVGVAMSAEVACTTWCQSCGSLYDWDVKAWRQPLHSTYEGKRS